MSDIDTVCSGCQGSGKCLTCDGSGNLSRNLPAPSPVGSTRSQTSQRICPNCYGSGTCQVCKGTGKAVAEKE